MKKILFALFVSSISLILLSCNNNNVNIEKPVEEVQQQETTVTDEILKEDLDDEDIDYTDDLSNEKFDGYEYRILIRKGHIHDQYLDEDSEDLVESATFRRNKLVEDMYGITITASESSNDNYDTDAINSILAGDDAYDVIFTHSRAAFVYANQGATLNFKNISTLHLDKPWWSKDIVENCTINGNLYVLDGDITTESLSKTMCLFFNKRIFDELGFDYPYEMVKNGEWTFDEFAYLAKKGGKDLNGDGIMDPDVDQYGFRAEAWEAPINMLYAGGQRIYSRNDEGVLELSLFSNKTVDMYGDFFNLMKNKSCILFGGFDHDYRGNGLFDDGRAMMTDSELRMAKSKRNNDDDFGIIPYPKYDIDDEYSTTKNGGSHLMIMPITVSDVERTGAITEALCAISSRDVLPAFYEQSLKSKYSRDEESAEMIDIIRDSIIYDIGYVSGGAFQSCGYDLAQLATPDFASYYAAGEKRAIYDLNEFNNSYGGLE